jgi:hypothetical protein
MKPCVAIALIIIGALVIMTPPASDYFHAKEVAKILAQAQEGPNRVSLGGGMSETYRFGCWAAGLLMVGFAVYGSMPRKSKTADVVSSN